MERSASSRGREGEIYAKLKSLATLSVDLIEQNYPKFRGASPATTSINSFRMNDGNFNIARALIGTEGTCVTILEAKVELVYSHPERVLLVLGYPDVYQAADHLTEILEFNPIALEGIDHRLYRQYREKRRPPSQISATAPGRQGWLLVEFGCDTQEEAANQAREVMEKLKARTIRPSHDC